MIGRSFTFTFVIRAGFALASRWLRVFFASWLAMLVALSVLDPVSGVVDALCLLLLQALERGYAQFC